MPTTIQLLVSMVGVNNTAVESLSDTFVSQFGRHLVVDIPAPLQFVKIPWPSTGEESVYFKFPQLANDYDVVFQWDSTIQTAEFPLTIPAGSGFIPIFLPKAKQASNGTVSYSLLLSPVDTPGITLPVFFF
jgi:hypothetical protein